MIESAPSICFMRRASESSTSRSLRHASGVESHAVVADPKPDVAVEAAKRAGGKLVMPKMPIPGVGYFAYCEDTERNLFGVLQADKNAK